MDKCGWSQRRAAEAVGVADSTLSRSGAARAAPEKREGRDGKFQPRKYTVKEREQRRDVVKQMAERRLTDGLWPDGHRQGTIGS